MRASIAGLAVLLAACSQDRTGPSTTDAGIDARVELPDLAISFGEDLPWAGPCDDSAHPCAMGQRCYSGQCVRDSGTCQSDEQCQNDSYCDCTGGGGGDAGACVGGVCVPWGLGPRGAFDPTCMGPAFLADDFKAPMTACSWTDTGARGRVVMTPLVIDLDGDTTPEIVFAPMGSHGDNYSERIVAVRSTDCSVIFDVDADLEGFGQLAAGDLDGDKVPELVGVDKDHRVRVFDNKGMLLAKSPTPFSFVGIYSDSSAAAIANVDGQGSPEIVIGGQVLRYVKGQAALQVVFTQGVPSPTWGTLSAVADLDGDGIAEVFAGTRVLDGLTGADKTPSSLVGLRNPGAYGAIADLNGDKKPDLVVVQSAQGSQQLTVIDFANDRFLFGPFQVSGGGWGGPPTVADFDGDGVPDIGLASSTSYYVYALKCAQNPKPAACKGLDNGVLWQKATQDASSGGTASSVFDFNGDGAAEVVYRDECWLRVYNGPDGRTLFAANITSGTALENPVVADVDGDGHADIVVSSDDAQASFGKCPGTPEAETGAPWTGYTRGVFVLRDPMNRWMPSRAIWNQSTYHITNVNDDGTIPVTETPSWLGWNNYRQNVQGGLAKPIRLPDVTAGPATAVEQSEECRSAWTLRVQLCNRGAAPLSAGVPGTFYSTDPRLPKPQTICSTKSTAAVAPGQCEDVECEWKNPPTGPVDLWFRGADDGTGGKSTTLECRPTNDVLYLPASQCMKVL